MKGFTIRRRLSTRYRVSLLGLFVLLLLLVLFGNEYGKAVDWHFRLPWRAHVELSAAELRSRNAALQEKLLILEQNSQVDRQAAALLQQQLIDAQKENFQLRKDLEFYQGIIHVKDDRKYPLIHELRIKPLARSREYRLELILLHISNTGKVLEGVLDVVLEGVEPGNVVQRMALSELSLERSRTHSIRVRNFRRVENNFMLPDNFQPQKIFVTLTMDDEEDSGFKEIFDWPLTASGEIADADVG